jgi:hypothetical protein
MKKFLLITATIGAFTHASAQLACNPAAPASAAKSYILPDSATGIAHGCAGVPYDETMYIKAFRDTTFLQLPATVDSFVINLDPATIGLPSYLSIASVPATLVPTAANNYPHIVLRSPSHPDSLACIRITGTVPAGTAAATTPLSIPFKVSATVGIPPFTLDTSSTFSNTSYSLTIDAPGTGACQVAIKQLLDVYGLQVVPNPAQGNAVLQCSVNRTFNGDLSISNSIGQILHTQTLHLSPGAQYVSLPVGNLAAGLYQVNLRSGNALSTIKLLVQ